MKKYLLFLAFIGALLVGNPGWATSELSGPTFDERFVKALKIVCPFNDSLSAVFWDDTAHGDNGTLILSLLNETSKATSEINFSTRKADGGEFYLDLRGENKTMRVHYDASASNVSVVEEKENAVFSSKVGEIRDDWSLPVGEGCLASEAGRRVTIEEVVFSLPWDDMYKATREAITLLFKFVDAELLTLRNEAPHLYVDDGKVLVGLDARSVVDMVLELRETSSGVFERIKLDILTTKNTQERNTDITLEDAQAAAIDNPFKAVKMFVLNPAPLSLQTMFGDDEARKAAELRRAGVPGDAAKIIANFGLGKDVGKVVKEADRVVSQVGREADRVVGQLGGLLGKKKKR
jgi:hypothetical protein